MDATLGLRDRHALDTVDAALKVEKAPGIVAAHHERDALETTYLGLADVKNLDMPPLRLTIVGVHAVELTGKEARLVTARGGTNLDNYVTPFIRVGRKDEHLEILLKAGKLLLQ